MKNHLYKIGTYILALAGIVSLGACNDIDGDYDEIVPESYYTIISLKDTGVLDVIMSVADKDYIQEIPVLKGGLHTDEVVEVMVEAPSQAWIDANYNERQGTNYKVLPASMYRITDYHLKIGPGETGRSVHVVFDAPAIYAEMQKPENSGKSLILPVKIATATKTVRTDKDVVILQCSVSAAVVGFDREKMTVKLPDHEPQFSTGIIVQKSGEIATDVRFEVMSQDDLDRDFGIPAGVNYIALTSDMYSMEPTATIAEDTEFFTQNVTFNTDRIRQAADNGVMVLPLRLVSLTQGAVVSRSEMLIECNFHEYTLAAMSDKSSWSVVYGTPSMPYGRFANIIDGMEDTSGWYSHTCEGWPGYQGLGNPYVVINLGSRVMIGQCGVQLAWSDGYYDTNPMAVEFYTTEQDNLDPGFTPAESKQLLYPNDERNFSDEFLSLAERARNYDNTVNWIHLATLTGLSQTQACNGVMKVAVPESVLSDQHRGQYLKVVVIPFPASQSLADRAKISEVYVDRVSAIDGESL